MVTTQYPTALPTTNQCPTGLQDDIDSYLANHQNAPHAEIIAMAAELGTLPKGDQASVKARLDNIESLISGDGWKLITKSELSGDVASVSFSNIPGTYDTLIVIAEIRGTNAVEALNTFIQMNGDSGNNYDYIWHYIYGDAGAHTGATVRGTSRIVLGINEADSARASNFSPCIIEIPGYTRTDAEKFTLSRSSSFGDVSADNDVWLAHARGRWRSTAAITSLTIFMTAGNIKSGSRFRLYGIKSG